MAVQNFNQSMEQKKQLDEMKRMQESQAIGQSIGNTVGSLVGTGMQAITQNIRERRAGGEEGEVKGNSQQPTVPQTTTSYQMPQLPTSLQGINNMMRNPFAIPQQMPTMMNGGNIERLIRKIDRHG